MFRSSIRVLVVDDFEPFRQFVSLTVQQELGLGTTLEAGDGAEVVELASKHQPALILLDIGLPKLNGIEAARQIRELSPQSKILFVSQESSVDVVQQALDTGACGYVFKADARRELVPAVRAVLRGETFVSRRFASYDVSRTSDPAAHGSMLESANPSRHEVAFCSDGAALLERLTQFVGAALKAGQAAVVVATKSHRDHLLPRLQADGLDIGVAIEEGRYIALDAADTLSTFMVNGMPDAIRFMKAFGDLILTAAKAAKREHPRVAVFGECVYLLWARGNPEAAIQMEKLGNQLIISYDVDILCGYSVGSVEGGMDSHIFQRICAEHSAVCC